MKVLDLRFNQLHKVPHELGNLPSIQKLYLSNNKKLRGVPEGITHLRKRGVEVTLDEDVAILSKDTSGNADLDVLHAWRERCPELQNLWPENVEADTWAGITWSAPLSSTGRSAAGGKRDLNGGGGGSGGGGGGDTPRVVKIHLANKGITGALPPDIGNLDALEVLDAESNEISSVPGEIGQLRALKLLDLRGNKLASVPWKLGNCAALTELNLRRNELTELPSELGQLASLIVMDLRGRKR